MKQLQKVAIIEDNAGRYLFLLEYMEGVTNHLYLQI